MDVTLPNPRFSLLPSGEMTAQHHLLAGINGNECNLSMWNAQTNMMSGLFSIEYNPPVKIAPLLKILEYSGWNLPPSLVLSSWEHRFCLIPQSLYQESHAEALFQTACGPLNPDEELIKNFISFPEAVLLFPIPATFQKIAQEKFNKVRFVHHMQSLLRDLSELPDNESRHKILLHVRSGRFDLLIAENGKPILLNSFPYQAPEDLVYFCLFSMETLSLKADKIPLWISGQVERQSMVYRQLHKYVRHLHALQRNKNCSFSNELDALPRHFFNALFQLPFCE
jgi:hypothetical protein